MSVFANKDKKDYELFFGDPVSIARYDRIKYPAIEKLTISQKGYFWSPDEIDCSKDKSDFRSLTQHEQHIFTSNLKRQIILDSVQGRAPVLAFLPVVSAPELEDWIITWSFFETIHSKSYSHIIRNVYSDPSKTFDGIMDTKEIVDCAKDISKYYNDLINWNTYSKRPSLDTGWSVFEKLDHKKSLWMALMAANALEGIRFYVSFACSWNFAELKKMEGNAKIIKLIARDENLHLAGTQQILKLLTKDPEFAKIKEDTKSECTQMFLSVVDQEKAWADYLFKDGSMIGLNAELLKEYVEYIASKRMKSVGLSSPFDIINNPLPWTQKWIAGENVQVAPQESELSSYIVGGVKMDATVETMKGLTL